MTHIFLSHLSKDNNTPEVAEQLFRPHAGNTAISVASRYNETPLYYITGAKAAAPTIAAKPLQATLF